MSSKLVHGLLNAVLFALAFGYFWIGIGLPLEWVDEGQIVYPSWRVSQGAVPYLDFQHIYGPSLFYFNAFLFEQFGVDLWVLRVAMLVIKSAIAALVFDATRRIATPVLAGVAYTIVLAAWGLPVPATSTPYANYFALLLTLVGIEVILRRSEPNLVRLVVAGACFGLATTFKQTSGAFGFIAAALFLLTERNSSGSMPGVSLNSIARVGRLAVPLVAFVVSAAYFTAENTAWNVAALLSPLWIIAARTAIDELGASISGEARLRGFQALVALSVGMAIPLTGYAIYYASFGGLDELVFNALAGLPQAIAWFVPIPDWDSQWLPWLGLGVGSGACIAAGGAARSSPRGCITWTAAGALTAVGCGVAIAVQDGGGHGPAAWWIAHVTDLYMAVPVMAGFLGALVFNRLRSGVTAHDRSRRLFGCFATTSLLQLYPAYDIWHVFMAMPPFVIVLCGSFPRFPGTVPRSWRLASTAFAVSIASLLIVPPALDLARESRRDLAVTHGLERASRIAHQGAMSKGGAELVATLAGPEYRERPLFVLSAKQLVYSLAGRESAVEPYEFGVYLAGVDLVGEAGLASIFDEQEMLEEIARKRPIVIDGSYTQPARTCVGTSPGSQRSWNATTRSSRRSADSESCSRGPTETRRGTPIDSVISRGSPDRRFGLCRRTGSPAHDLR